MKSTSPPRPLWMRAMALVAVAGSMGARFPRWWPYLIAASAALVLVGFRSKAPSPPGTLASSSADRLGAGRPFPGQLSLTQSEIIWKPSKYSQRRGEHDVVFPLDQAPGVRLAIGPGILDGTVTITSNDHAATFGTHRTSRLWRRLGMLSQTP